MGLRYFLDTNTCIYIVKQKPKSVLDRFKQTAIGEAAMSTITYGELLYGTQKSQQPKEALFSLQKLISLIPLLPLPVQAASYYGQIRSRLEKKGKPIGNNDLWIAAYALALELIIVTRNIKEFSRIEVLQLENWVTED